MIQEIYEMSFNRQTIDILPIQNFYLVKWLRFDYISYFLKNKKLNLEKINKYLKKFVIKDEKYLIISLFCEGVCFDIFKRIYNLKNKNTFAIRYNSLTYFNYKNDKNCECDNCIYFKWIYQINVVLDNNKKIFKYINNEKINLLSKKYKFIFHASVYKSVRKLTSN